jgi:hypothetical protein
MVDLLARDRVTVVRHPGDVFSHPSFELAGDDLQPLAWMTRTSGTAWREGDVHYAVAYDDGRPLWTVLQYSTPTVSRFEVTAASGEPLGRIDQENALFAPRLALIDAEDNTIRLEGSRTTPRAWQLQDLAGQALGRVVRSDPAARTGRLQARRYAVERGDGLGGGFWALALVAAVCLDIVADRRT